MPWGPSTVRAELARLEEVGLLEHPHTSAGRVPTDRGYRVYVDELLDRRARCRCRASRSSSPTMRREVDEAMRATSEQLSQVTNLLALVTAPPIETATIHRVEVLLLQPQVAMVVIITSTGGVTKRVISYDAPVDRGLVDWAGSYLNEALGGLDVGSRMLLASSTAPVLSAAPSGSSSRTLAPAFTELEDTAESTLFMEGAARLLSEHRFQELSQIGATAWRCSSTGARCSACCAQSLDRAERVPAHRQREPGAGAALALHRGRELRAGAPQPRRRVGDRAGAHGLPGRDHRRARRPPASCRASWPRCTTNEARPVRGARRLPRRRRAPRSRRRSGGSRASCTRT